MLGFECLHLKLDTESEKSYIIATLPSIHKISSLVFNFPFLINLVRRVNKNVIAPFLSILWDIIFKICLKF